MHTHAIRPTGDDAPRAPHAPMTRFWTYAAAFGAIWGAVEITLGAFLHTLKLPLSSPLLAALGAAVLVAQRQLLDLRGLTLATGLVAAACKLLSPAGAVFGPMLGIAVEALLVELALLFGARSLPAALLAGVLAVSWAVGQKFIMQVLVYGGDLIALYLALLRRLGGWLGLDASAGVAAATLAGALLFALGLAAGAWGLRLGRLARHRRLAEARA